MMLFFLASGGCTKITKTRILGANKIEYLKIENANPAYLNEQTATPLHSAQ